MRGERGDLFASIIHDTQLNGLLSARVVYRMYIKEDIQRQNERNKSISQIFGGSTQHGYVPSET